MYFGVSMRGSGVTVEAIGPGEAVFSISKALLNLECLAGCNDDNGGLF